MKLHRSRRLPTRLRPRWNHILRLERLESRDVPSTSIPLSSTSWTALGPGPILNGQTPGNTPVTGRIAAVAADPTDPNTLYVASAGGGVWKTTDGGNDWTPLTDNQPTLFMGAIAVSPSNPNVIYAGTGEATNSISSFYGRGVLLSSDGGASWTLEGTSVFDRRVISQIVIAPDDPNTAYVAVEGAGTNGSPGPTGVYKTTDGGKTWANTTASISVGDNYTDLAMDPSDKQTLYTAVGTINGSVFDSVYKTTDGGATWAHAGNFPLSRAVGNTKIAVAPSSPNVVYATIAGTGRGNTFGALYKVFKSTDSGQTWNELTGIPNYMGNQGWYDSTLAVSPSDPDVVFVAGQSGDQSVLESADGGLTWTGIASGIDGNGPHNDHHGIGFDANGNLLDGTDGGIWRLDNADPNNIIWTDINGNLQLTQYIGVALDPSTADVAYGGSQDNGISKFTDSLTWTQVQFKDGGFVRVDHNNPQTVYHTFEYIVGLTADTFLERSDDGGQTWNVKVNGINTTGSGAFYPPFIMDPNDSNRLIVALNRVYVTDDQGEDWTPISPGGQPIDSVATFDANTVYYAVGAQIFVTFDGGQSWTAHTIPGFAGHYQSLVVDPYDPLTAYAVRDQFGGQVFQTHDGGVTWANISNNLPDLPAYSLVIDPTNGTIYVGNDNGVYASIDGGQTWAAFGDSLPHTQVHDLELSTDLNILAAGTHGRGLWEIEIDGGGHATRRARPLLSGLAPALRMGAAAIVPFDGKETFGAVSSGASRSDNPPANAAVPAAQTALASFDAGLITIVPIRHDGGVIADVLGDSSWLDML